LVKIRLKRMGAKKRPFYRLVVADSRSPRDGRFIELLGYYDPLTNPAKVQVDADKVHEWIRKGARPSDAARALLVQQGILAKVPRVFKPAPEAEKATPPTSQTSAATEEPGAVASEVEAQPDADAQPSSAAADEPVVDAVAEPAAGVEPTAASETAADETES
jgi:small subunit ribosomal protein S16